MIDPGVNGEARSHISQKYHNRRLSSVTGKTGKSKPRQPPGMQCDATNPG